MSNTNSASMSPSHTHMRAIFETAIFVAVAMILNFLRINILPWGGSLDFLLVPLCVVAIRWGMGWGFAAGFVFGVIKCVTGEGVSFGWQSMILDYFVAYSVIGLAGIFYRRTGWRAVAAVIVAGVAQFAVFVLSGVVLWRAYMPEEFLSMVMTNPWVYSLLYNGTYMLPNTVICSVVMGLLSVPLGKYLQGEDLA